MKISTRQKTNILALVVGLLAAWFNGDLFVVAISCCLTVLVTSFIF